MRKLLIIGDAACQTGFAKSTHYIADVLQRYYHITVLGLNHLGGPHQYPYDIYPAHIASAPHDWLGLGQVPKILQKVKPDVVLVQNDPWNFVPYCSVIPDVPVVGIVAVDGMNCRGYQLNGLLCAIFWTEFGRREAIKGRFRGPAAVIPLGVDRTIFYPRADRDNTRLRAGLPESMLGKFIIGNVGRNQPRKRLDLSVRYFAEWLKKYKADDAYLFLHVAPTGDRGIDPEQLAAYYGIANKIIIQEPEPYHGIKEERLGELYSCFDVMINTGQGEGFGLPALEAMACKVPCILPDFAAFSDWARDAAVLVPCTSTCASFENVNTIGGIADEEMFVESLQEVYSNRNGREKLAELGYARSNEDRFSWPLIGERVHDAIEESLKLKSEVLTRLAEKELECPTASSSTPA